MDTGNPFARRETHNAHAITAYKVFTAITWLLAVVASVYYTFARPTDGKHRLAHTIWGQNHAHPTPFALNSIVTSIYW
jgi:hypothetical protein